MQKIKNSINISKKKIALVLSIALMISVLPLGVYAQAQEREKYLEVFENDIEQVFERFQGFLDTTNEIALEEKPVLEQIFLNDFENNSFEVQTAVSNLNLYEKNIIEDEEGYFHVVIPIKNYNILSNFTVIYNNNFDLIRYSEIHIQESENGFFKVLTYLNGRLIVETETEFEFIENEQFEEELQAFEDMLSNPSVRNWCLVGVLGVGIIVAGLIFVACVVFCPVTAGGGCVACIGAFAVIGAATITAVASCFNNGR